MTDTIRRCKACGKEFYGKKRACYCSVECRREAAREQQRGYKRAAREKEAAARKNAKKKVTLGEAVGIAKKAGLSYGQAVAKGLIP